MKADKHLSFTKLYHRASQVVLVLKNLPANAGDVRDMGLIPVLGKSSAGRKWHPTPVLLPGKSHGQKGLRATVHGTTDSQA